MAVVEFDNVCYRYAAHGSAADSSAAPQTEAQAATVRQLDASNQRGHEHGGNQRDSNQRGALNNISLSIEAGEFIAVIGANGSGKSTLAKHVNGLLAPLSGRVLTVGLDTTDLDTIFEIRSHAGMVFQNPDSQMVASIVADDVAFGCENLAVPYEEMVSRVDTALSSVKMSSFSQRNPAHLSGGQKQRVCIAGVLAMQPEILILDEPGAMLDVRGRRGIRRIIRELNKAGMTIILITHFMEEAMLAERVYLIDKGQIALTGSPVEVFSQKQKLRELSMDLPFSLLLAEELRQRGLPVPEIVNPEQLKEELSCWYATN